MSFKIVKHEKQRTVTTHVLRVMLVDEKGQDQTVDLTLQAVNGKVIGTAKTGVSTSKPMYFTLPIEVRQRHFDEMKTFIEKKLPVKTYPMFPVIKGV